MSDSKFDFYDVIKVITDKKHLQEINGSLGAVMGMSQHEETGEWSYGVSIDNDEGLVWTLKAEDMLATGQKRSREDYYSGETVRVSVDPETGEGKLEED